MKNLNLKILKLILNYLLVFYSKNFHPKELFLKIQFV